MKEAVRVALGRMQLRPQCVLISVSYQHGLPTRNSPHWNAGHAEQLSRGLHYHCAHVQDAGSKT